MAIGDRLRERRAKRKEKEITPAEEQETKVPGEKKTETLTLSPANPQEKETSGKDKKLTFSEFAGNPEEFMINFAKRNPEPDITEGLNFFKSGNYTVPAEALNYFGKELDEYLKSRNIPEEDRERIKKKIRRTRIADALMKTANIIGQTVAVAKGGTPVPINGRPVLQSLKDQTERRQKEWERELEYALQNDKALNTRAYSDYLQRMMDDRKSARDAELKRDIADQNYDLGIKKLANDVEIEKIRGESRRNAAYINSAKTNRRYGSSIKTFEFMVNNITDIL